MDTKPVLPCEVFVSPRLNHGEIETEVLKKSPVAVPFYKLQFPDGHTSKRTWTFSDIHGKYPFEMGLQ
jgi:hypothetical protein